MTKIACIISGGAGTRLWPLSRQMQPKQFHDLVHAKRNLLTLTGERLRGIGDMSVLTLAAHGPAARGLMAEKGLQPEMILEPVGRNTAAAVALMTKVALSKDPKSIVGIFPADHLIDPENRFRRHVEIAFDLAAHEQKIVTMGIIPIFPATAYGYMEIAKDPRESIGDSVPVRRFIEKPNIEKAQALIQAGKVVWNAGIYIFPAAVMAEKIKSHMPGLWTQIESIKDDFSNIKDVYAHIVSQSIDYGVMEKLDDLLCIPTDVSWSDLGSWEEVAAHDKQKLSYVEMNAHDNYYTAAGIEPKKVVFLGCDETYVVDTPDAMLVMKKGQGQKVKDVVGMLESTKDRHLIETHTFESRPWGSFRVLGDTADFKAKSITVLPGQKLSYQSHAKRAEHWTIVRGVATVTLNDVEHNLKAGEHIYIPLKAKHRIANPGTAPMEFVEVQVGSYFGEDDIVRYSDDYGRK